MKIWLRILGGAYILVGSLNSFVFLFILGVYGGKGGVEAIRVEEYDLRAMDSARCTRRILHRVFVPLGQPSAPLR
jgi:hypothetical protein